MQTDQQEIECPHCRGQINFVVTFSVGQTSFKIPSVGEGESLTPVEVVKVEEIEL